MIEFTIPIIFESENIEELYSTYILKCKEENIEEKCIYSKMLFFAYLRNRTEPFILKKYVFQLKEKRK